MQVGLNCLILLEISTWKCLFALYFLSQSMQRPFTCQIFLPTKIQTWDLQRWKREGNYLNASCILKLWSVLHGHQILMMLMWWEVGPNLWICKLLNKEGEKSDWEGKQFSLNCCSKYNTFSNTYHVRFLGFLITICNLALWQIELACYKSLLISFKFVLQQCLQTQVR